jgi:hypothetical protein
LRRGVGTGHAKNGASSEEERAHGEVIDFPPIITLNGFHGAAKLGRNVGKKEVIVVTVLDFKRNRNTHR